jgi:hypothetical protein
MLSSVGSEHLPYKQGVTGSNPVVSTYRGVEQLAARWAHNPKVVGSNPSPATYYTSSCSLAGDRDSKSPWEDSISSGCAIKMG